MKESTPHPERKIVYGEMSPWRKIGNINDFKGGIMVFPSVILDTHPPKEKV